MQLKVIKADGSIEEYLHTKVIGTINNALVLNGEPNISVAEQLAETITYFLYSKERRRTVTSSEIFSMIQVVLAATWYEQAAVVLSEYQYKRQLGRRRIEVIDNFSGWELPQVSWWNKSTIVNDLITEQKIQRQTARAIASMVEEKILKMGIARVSRGLIKQLVLADTAAMLRAEQQLQAATSVDLSEASHADRDICLRQQQKGLCKVGL